MTQTPTIKTHNILLKWRKERINIVAQMLFGINSKRFDMVRHLVS